MFTKIHLLKPITMLFVEDEQMLIDSVVPTFSKFFKNVLVAKDGQEALNILNSAKEKIDIIVSDCNMPIMDGLTFLKIIRESNQDIPFIFLSGTEDSNVLIKAIQYNVNHFLKKPLNMRELLTKVIKEAENAHIQKTNEHQKQEITEYVNIINQIAIISKTDLKGNITFVNDIFCEISKYTKEEIIGKPHNILRHQDVQKETYRNMWNTIQKGNIWKGSIKNKDKEGEDYSVNATIFPIFNEDDTIKEYMAVRFLTTDEELKRRAFKSDIMKKIIEFQTQKTTYQEKISQLEMEVFTLKNDEFLKQKLKNEEDKNKKLLNQLEHYEKDLIKKDELCDEKIKQMQSKLQEAHKIVMKHQKYAKTSRDEASQSRIEKVEVEKTLLEKTKELKTLKKDYDEIFAEVVTYRRETRFQKSS